MSEASMQQFVEDRLLAMMAIHYPDVPVQLPNVRFDEPENKTYVAVWIINGKAFQAELGKKSFDRHIGILQIDIMTPQNNGLGEANELAEFLNRMFKKQSKQLTDGATVTFKVGTPENKNATRGYARKMLSIPFYRDEPKS